MNIDKICPRCGASFVCKHSADCWCATIKVTPQMREVMKEYNDCLCHNCLNQLKSELK